MLIRFRVGNYRSIRDTAELTFPTIEGGRPTAIAAIYGANASGKSNLLMALEFMRDAVVGSHASWNPTAPPPRTPFVLDAASASEPSLFEIDAMVEGVRYQYGFTLGPERVEEEWLYSYPEVRRRTLLERTGQEFEFGRNFKGPSRTVSELVRPNSLFISAAAMNNHEGVADLFGWFTSVMFGGISEPVPLSTRRTELLLQGDTRHEVERMLTQADLGIAAVNVRNETLPPEMTAAMRDFVKRLTPEADFDDPDAPDFTTRTLIEFEHLTESGERVSIAMKDESRGTQMWFSHLGSLLQALREGRLLVVDELDASLHPKLSSEIVNLFANPGSNPYGAQLIFSTHDTSLLGNLLDAHLSREDVWFTEKDSSGATLLYPLTDFRPRRSEALERGYLQGRYGGVPIIDLAELAEQLS